MYLPVETVDPAGSITGEKKSSSLAAGQTPGSPVICILQNSSVTSQPNLLSPDSTLDSRVSNCPCFSFDGNFSATRSTPSLTAAACYFRYFWAFLTFARKSFSPRTSRRPPLNIGPTGCPHKQTRKRKGSPSSRGRISAPGVEPYASMYSSAVITRRVPRAPTSAPSTSLRATSTVRPTNSAPNRFANTWRICSGTANWLTTPSTSAWGPCGSSSSRRCARPGAWRKRRTRRKGCTCRLFLARTKSRG